MHFNLLPLSFLIGSLLLPTSAFSTSCAEPPAKNKQAMFLAFNNLTDNREKPLFIGTLKPFDGITIEDGKEIKSLMEAHEVLATNDVLSHIDAFVHDAYKFDGIVFFSGTVKDISEVRVSLKATCIVDSGKYCTEGYPTNLPITFSGAFNEKSNSMRVDGTLCYNSYYANSFYSKHLSLEEIKEAFMKD